MRARTSTQAAALIASLMTATVAGAAIQPLPARAEETASGSVGPADLALEAERPGISRVIGDGTDHTFSDVHHVEVNPDGRIWAAGADGRVFVVGEPGSFDPDVDDYPRRVRDLIALDDGSVVVHDRTRLASWDGTTWSRHGSPGSDVGATVRSAVRAEDGGLWVLLDPPEGPDGPQLVHVGPDGNTYLTIGDLGIDSDQPLGASSLARTPDGSVWVGLVGVFGQAPTGLVRFDGESWTPENPFGDGEPFAADDLEVGGDGVLSARLFRERRRGPVIGRWDGAAWTLSPNQGTSDAASNDPDRSEWPAEDWLRWWPLDETNEYAFPAPFANARVTDQATAPDGSEWVVLSVGKRSQGTDVPEPGLYLIDPEAATASRPEVQTVGRHGLVPLLHPRFATKGAGDGNKRAKWTQAQGTDVVAEVFGLGDQWYAALDSVGPAGDRWVRNNSVGSGTSPTSAIEDALSKEKRVTFVRKAAKSALLEWPLPSDAPVSE